MSQQNELSISPQLLGDLKGRIVVVKYGGNAMTDEATKEEVLRDIAGLMSYGLKPVVVHGGGPVIKQTLDQAGIQSEFVEGHRLTDEKSMFYVEMALKGAVSGELVRILRRYKAPAVGLSGKDGAMVISEKRYHINKDGGQHHKVDLGRVGDVKSVDPQLIVNLIEHHFLPVIAPVALGEDGLDYNINADMFAGHIAAALKAHAYIVLTDVPGLLKNPDDPSSLIDSITLEELDKQGADMISEGMIPKIESCRVALDGGVESACIVNGTVSETLTRTLLCSEPRGTTITR